jgi:hypothetical protein
MNLAARIVVSDFELTIHVQKVKYETRPGKAQNISFFPTTFSAAVVYSELSSKRARRIFADINPTRSLSSFLIPPFNCVH